MKRPGKMERKFAKLQFGYQQRVDLYNQLISLLATGMNTTDALRMAYDVASHEGKKPKELDAIILSEVILAMKNGDSLAKALSPWVPKEEVMSIGAFLNSDDFIGNLRSYLETQEKKRKIKSTIISGMIYPVLLFTMIYGVMMYFGNSIVPTIAELLPMDRWTGPALFLTFMYHFSRDYAVPGVVAIVVGLAVIIFLLPRWSGAGRSFADKLPIFSTYRMYTGISFLMSVSSLMQGGVPTTDALKQIEPHANRYVKTRIVAVRRQMMNGANFGAALYRAGSGWPDAKMNLNIKIFAETQDLSAQLSKLAKMWVDQSQIAVERNMGLLRTVSMFAVFGVIMGIVVGVYALQGQIGTSAMAPG